jgi:hypothetical protein
VATTDQAEAEAHVPAPPATGRKTAAKKKSAAKQPAAAAAADEAAPPAAKKSRAPAKTRARKTAARAAT